MNFRKTQDARMKQLASEGIGVSLKQADPITPEQDNALWESDNLGKASSQAIIHTLFYYNCKLFGLRGHDDHRNLQTSYFHSECGHSSRLYDIYTGYLHSVGQGPFYRRPLEGCKFGTQPIGINKLYSIMKNMCKNAGFEGNFSNHSGKRTSAKSLYHVLSLLICHAQFKNWLRLQTVA
ncbi:uncharacterized protein [Argopecten irradians]|uniref:uncharacterized protein n=1 Tax=Argopecten irradians TaxID=31199 RepID=UPI00371F1D6B